MIQRVQKTLNGAERMKSLRKLNFLDKAFKEEDCRSKAVVVGQYQRLTAVS